MGIRYLAAAAASLFVATQAHALPELVAGWDFSQSCLAGSLCDSSFQPIQQLVANYSDRDPTSGMGAESADFGTLFLDGQFGSSNVPGFGGAFNPTSPNLTLDTESHTNFPVTMGAAANASIMQNEIPGVAYQSHSGLATDTVDLVFKADLSALDVNGLLAGGSDWELSFAAASIGASSVDIKLSTDGGFSYGLVASEDLTTAEEVVTVDLGGTHLSMVFVMLSFDGAEDDTRIDNLALRASVLVPAMPGWGSLVLSSVLLALGSRATRSRLASQPPQ